MSSPPRKPDFFSSRYALILASLGMAIGAGNIWRFPRIVAKFEHGGTLLIPWIIFLFSWSIPLLVVETSIGRKTRRGVVSSLGFMLGRTRTWVGAFVALCTIGIMCYYAVVAGWCWLYILESIRGIAAEQPHGESAQYFSSLAQGPYSALAMFGAYIVAGFFVAKGFRKGIELANKIFLPTLLLLLVALIFVGLSLEGAGQGFSWMFSVGWSELATPNPWLEALSQSAWSTGAGWGLLLVLSIGSRRRSGSVADATITGIGNNIASLIAAMATIPAVFALAPLAAPGVPAVDVLKENGPGNTGMAMVWLPKIFAQVEGWGVLLSTCFFVALTFAAMTSLIAMVELATRTLMDLGLSRGNAIITVIVFGTCLSLPSALSLEVFGNQDWAWGVGLIVSGFLFVLAVGKLGFSRFRKEWVGAGDGGAGVWLRIALSFLIPLQFILLLGWWFWQSFGWYGGEEKAWGEKILDSLNPFGTYTIGTCLLQWGLAFLVLFMLNKKLSADIPEVLPEGGGVE